MKLTIDDLKEYSKMDTLQRHQERGKAIRAELEERMRWMPIKWRRLIRCRFILGYSPTRTAMEIHISRTSVFELTKKIAAWLENTDEYLKEIT